MPRFHDDSDEDFRDDDDVYSEFEDVSDNDEEEPTVLCTQCGFEMLEIVYQCPRCGEIPSREVLKSSTQPRWVIVTALLLLGLLFWWILT